MFPIKSATGVVSTLVLLGGTSVFAFELNENKGAPSASLPNIVLINADDLGYGDLGCYGATRIKTPNMDRLAKEGRKFTDAHSASAVCSPSRYGLLTGRYPFRKNLWGPVPLRAPLTINPKQLTIASLLKKSGYHTACIGKWHLGFGEKQPDWNGELKPGPLELGFDYYFGIPTVNSGPPFVYVENHRVVGADPNDPFVYRKKSVTKNYPEKGGYAAIGGAVKAHQLYDDEQVATTLCEKSVTWIKQQDGTQPFFLYLATTNIHHPFTPAKQFVGTSDCGLYGDFVHELDWLVGQVLKALDDKKFSDNTLVIFTSDNGGMFHVTGQKAFEAGHHMNGKLLGYKFGAWEGGHRVPLIVRWPKKIPANSKSDQLISQIDLLATFARITNETLSDEQKGDSVDQLDNLRNAKGRSLRKSLVICPNSPRHLSLRSGDWVYIPKPGDGGFQGKKPGDHLFSGYDAMAFTGRKHSDLLDGKRDLNASRSQLYHLVRDPGQAENVVEQFPQKADELKRLLESYRKQIGKNPPIGWINLKQK